VKGGGGKITVVSFGVGGRELDSRRESRRGKEVQGSQL